MCHVLIIEDDWLFSDHIAQLVEAAGAVSIDTADTEDEAVALALAHHPEVIISDVTLAAGTGPAAVDRITAELGQVPVMFITGEPRGFTPRSPEMCILHKPVADRTLLETFKALASLPHK